MSSPKIDAGARVARTASIEGDVTIGAGSCVLAGARIVAQGAPVVIGRQCVIMENAVIRGAGAHPCTIGERVLVGPHAHISGATLEAGVFIGTGAAVLYQSAKMLTHPRFETFKRHAGLTKTR